MSKVWEIIDKNSLDYFKVSSILLHVNELQPTQRSGSAVEAAIVAMGARLLFNGTWYSANELSWYSSYADATGLKGILGPPGPRLELS